MSTEPKTPARAAQDERRKRLHTALHAQGVRLGFVDALELAAPLASRPDPHPAATARPATHASVQASRGAAPLQERRTRRREATEHERRTRRADALEREARRLQGRALERFAESLGDRKIDTTTIPRSLWVLCWWACSDSRGTGVRALVHATPNTVAKTIVLRAALGIGDDGRARYDWTDQRARRIAALGCALITLARPTRRRDAFGGGEVIGVPRSAFCALLRDEYDRTAFATPHVNTVFGVHRAGATAASGQVGYWPALREAGLGYSRQLPIGEAAPAERLGGDWATNRYAIVSAHVLNTQRATAHAYDARAFAEAFAGLPAAVSNGWEHELGLWARGASPPS